MSAVFLKIRDNCLVDDTNRAGVDTETRLTRTLRAWMRYADKSVVDLHKRTGISRATITNVGKIGKTTHIATLERLAPELGTTPGALLDGVPPPGIHRGATLPDHEARLRQLEAEALRLGTAADRTELLEDVLDILLTAEELPGTLRDRMRAKCPIILHFCS